MSISSSAAVPQGNRTVREDSTKKAQSFQLLLDAVCEVVAATRAFAVASGNKELARRVGFSRPNAGRGHDTEVLARCHDVFAAATNIVGSPGDYGVTQAKLTALKKKIWNFRTVQSKPRDGRAMSSSATKKLAKFFRQVAELLDDRLDAMAAHFKDSQSTFSMNRICCRQQF